MRISFKYAALCCLVISFPPLARAQSSVVSPALLSRAQAGPVRVIIGVDAGMSVPEGALAGDEVSVQRAAIAVAQDSLLSQLAGHSTGEVVRFGTVPFVSMYLNAAGLLMASRDSNVTSVQEDVPLRASLKTSTVQIGAAALWARGVTGGGTSVAVLDTGTQISHPLLLNATTGDACFGTNGTTSTGGSIRSLCPGRVSSIAGTGTASGCTSTDPSVCEHGTHVAGIARVISDSSWVIPIQVFSEINDATSCYPSAQCLSAFNTDIIRALEYVSNYAGTTNAARVVSVNMSLGGSVYSGACDSQFPAYKAIIDTLRSRRIATVVAAGNDGAVGLSVPACISTAISVGSVTKSDGPTPYSNVSSQLSVEAPGDQIVSSVPVNSYASMSGTSMAAPHVAGAWALLAHAFPTRSVTDILTALRLTGKPINDAGFVVPRIQVDSAYNLLASQTPQQPPGAPVGLSASVSGPTVTITWGSPQSGGAVASYIVEAGSASGAANLFNGSVGLATELSATVGPGTYFVRVRARNAAGTSAPSNEVVAVVGGACVAPPVAPTLTGKVGGGLASAVWTASAGATSYVLEAGTASGAGNIFNDNVGNMTSISAALPQGFVVFVRVFAVNACGQSGASNQLVLTGA